MAVKTITIDLEAYEALATYGRLLAWQSRREGRIATMDLLIATSAVVAGAPLVTRNAKDFPRVPDLEIVSY